MRLLWSGVECLVRARWGLVAQFPAPLKAGLRPWLLSFKGRGEPRAQPPPTRTLTQPPPTP